MSSPAPATAPALRDRIVTRSFAFWAFLAVLYGQLALALMPSWSDGTYYDYGYLAAFLAPWFFLIRWKESGCDERQLDRGLRSLAASKPTLLVMAGAAVFILLLRMIQGADAHWRVPLYLHAGTVLAVTAWLLVRIQGRAALTYWACAGVVLLAVPQPSRVEMLLINALTEGVLEVALFTNRMLGLPLESTGETIIANGIPLHVSDGCSGIRSFQSGIFAGFVLGEFLRLGLVSRFVLVAAGLGMAFVMNCGRVIYLVRHAVAYPDADLQKVHDISGYVSLTLTFLAIAGIGWLLQKINPAAPAGPPPVSG